jgi:hypothetical protein
MFTVNSKHADNYQVAIFIILRDSETRWSRVKTLDFHAQRSVFDSWTDQCAHFSAYTFNPLPLSKIKLWECEE